MTINVGVNVIEVDGKASPSIQGAPTSVAAFLGLTERGIPNQPARIVSVAQFREKFGGYRNGGYLAYALDGFFLNGGREAYVSRVVGAGSLPAKLTISSRGSSPGPSLRIQSGGRGTPDPGAWGNRLAIDIRDDSQLGTSLQTDIGATATKAQLGSVEGIQIGSVVGFYDSAAPTNTTFRRIVSLDSTTNRIEWKEPLVSAFPKASTDVKSAEFRLAVFYQADPGGEYGLVEDWRRLSMEPDSPDYVATRINHTMTGSSFIMVIDESGSAPSGFENPALTSNQSLTSGSESSCSARDFIGDSARKTGLYAFDTKQVQLLAIPDGHLLSSVERQGVVSGALDYAAARGDCMYVGSAPDRGSSVQFRRALHDYTQMESDYLDAVKSFASKFQAAKVYGALYAPWIQVNDPLATGSNPTLFVPPDGHLLGVYARTEQERGIWKAPAGQQSVVRGCLNVAASFSDIQHTVLVREARVNGVRSLPGQGITVSASRTLSTDTRWWFVSTRLLFNFIKSSLRDGLRFVRQEPHTEELRRTVRFNVVTPFLLGLWRGGAFGSEPPARVFSVKCDSENNPPTEVDLGNFRVEVYFYPVRPAETILITVGQQPSGAATSDS